MTRARLMETGALLASTRAAGTLLDNVPAELRPTSLEEAYVVQFDVARRLGAIGGWKVGLPKEGEEHRATPIPARYILASGSNLHADTARLEVELALKMRTALPTRAMAYQRAEVLAAIGSAHVAFEILGKRFKDRGRIDSLTYLADGQGSGGLMLGGVIANWTELALETLPMTLAIEGIEQEKVVSGPSFERTLDAMVWLANHAAAWSAGLGAGQIILTGARIGATPIDAGQHVEAVANGMATVSLTVGG
jgi:2-keto-4-pentenoate hydratase